LSSPPDPAGRGGDTRTGIDVGRRLAPGTRVADRYVIERLLGIGGMGLVYKARDEALAIDVALKVLRPDLAADPDWVARFRRELLLARDVSHRNVVRIHDIGEHDGLRFITMQYVEGSSLAERLGATGRLDPASAVPIAAQLADALHHAHLAGVVHRDLKPANVLLGEDGTAYLGDFGVARSRDRSDGLTRAGSVVGTPDYLSPEQVSGDPVDGRSDVYALGIVLYEMLTGELPFRGGTQTEVLAQRLTGNVRRVADSGVEVAPWLEAVIRRCLERDPAARWATAGELRDALLAGRAPAAPARSRWWLAAAAAALLAGGAVVAVRSPKAPAPDELVPPGARSPAAAVLPFADESGDVSLAWAGRGIAEMLSTQLAETAELRVLDPARVERTLADLQMRPRPDDDVALRRLASLLEVDRVITGTLRKAGPVVRIDARLLTVEGSTSSAQALAAEGTGEAPLFAAVAALGGRARAVLTGRAPAAEPESPPTRSLEAAAAWRAGRDALDRGDARAAVVELEKATSADPRFAPALEGLAEALQATGQEARATEAAKRAVEAAPAGSRLALRARARLEMLEGRPEEATRAFGQLVERFPRDVEALLDLAAAQGAQGDVGQAIATLRKATEVDRADPRAWFLLGKNEILAGEAARAVNQDLVQALTLQTQLRNEPGQAEVLNALGVGFHQLGDYPRALEHYSRAAQARERLQDERGTAISLKNRGRVLVAMGRFGEAEPDLEQAQRRLQALGDRAGVAGVLDDLGVLHEGRGDYARARAVYQEALVLRRGLGDERALAQSFDNVGYLTFLQGDYDGAGVYWQQALALRTRLGDKGGEILSRQNLGFLQTAQGRWAEATRTFLGTLEDSRKIEFKNAAAVAQGNLGLLYGLEGRPGAAQKAFADALAVFRELGDRRGEAEFTIRQAASLLEVGDAAAAAPLLQAAAGLVKETGNREQAADLQLAKAEAARLAGDPGAARTALGQAVAEAQASHGRVAHLRARVAQAAFEAGEGRGDARLLSALHEEARTLGDALLAMRAGEGLARAHLAAGRVAEAERAIDAVLQQASRAGWGVALARLHAARAAIRMKAGRAADAERDWQQAAAAADRVRRELPETGRAAWDALPTQRSIAGARG
jgi:tetratricopeptide (TPR) repeat protein/TolB-like protein